MSPQADSEKTGQNDLAAKVFTAFKETFELQDDVDRNELVYQQTPNWDSVGHMTLVAGLEELFDCMLDTDDILDMSSYQKAVEIMSKY